MESDVVIIGSGQAATPLANRLVERGQSVIVIERGDLGGTCVNTGCTPTKTMIASARAAHVARTAATLGVTVGEVKVDLGAVVDRKNAMVARWRQGVEKRLTTAARMQLLRGHARFVDRRTVEVAGQRHSGKSIVINVGARDHAPSLAGLDSVPWLNHARIMELRQVPAHLLVLGGGYIGCEMAQMFRRFGAEVTMISTAERLLPKEDADVSQVIEEVFRAEGITLGLGARPVSVSRGDGAATVALELADGRRITGSHLLVATGRRPNTDDLDCAAAGIDLDDPGYVVVDDHYRTSNPDVHAVGDAIAGPQFTHVAWDDHRRLLAILTGRTDVPAKGRADQLVPYAVFTDPQVAGVGLSQKEAQGSGIRHDVARFPFGKIARAIETDQTAGVVKVIVDAATDRILGARIVGAEAGELIHVFAALMRAGASSRVLVEGQMVHPTFAEGLQSALMTLPRFA
jgi:pyruvate/2-oxoglutarate dehydrogenase complex dihydrolipoamide dehydrogenase (E3) component